MAEKKHSNGNGKDRRENLFKLIRAYTILGAGIFLVLYAFLSGPVKPGALTLGGALIGFNPLFQATTDAGGGR